MVPPVAADALRARRTALLLLFAVPGVTIGSWVTRTPEIKDALQATTGGFGLVLLALSVGSMLGILGSGPLVARFGTRRIASIGMSGVVLSMPLVGGGAGIGSSALVAAGLACFGLGMGTAEIAMNVEGADLEAASRRSVLPTMHGFFSLGTVVGAALGILATAVRFSVTAHLVLVGVVALATAVLCLPRLATETGRRATKAPEEHRAHPRVWTDRRLILIGVLVFGLALAEGTATDWLPILMVDEHGVDPALGSLVFTIFAASMTAGRLSAPLLLRRFTRSSLLRGSAAAGVLGIAGVVFLDHDVAAGAAVILWGLGASLAFPLSLSAAGDSGPDPAARVSLASVIAYTAFLVGPPLVGFLGDHVGLRSALVAVLVAVVVAVLVAPAARVGADGPQPRTQEPLLDR
jgi:fucose permease